MAGKQKPIRHGTPAGYVAHKRRGEAACARCVTAWRLYYQSRNGQLPRAVLLRNQARLKHNRAISRGTTNRWRARRLSAAREEHDEQASVEDPAE